MNRDTVIGIVGATILVLAMVGVFAYESAQTAGLGTGVEVAWRTASAAAIEGDGTTALGASTEAALDVQVANMTNLTWTLTWAPGTAAASDTLRLTVIPPADVSAEPIEVEPSASGTITVTVPVPNRVPADTTAAADDDATRARLAAMHTSRAGMGAWGFVVEFVSSSGPAPGPASAVGASSSVQWTISAVPEVYEPVLSAQK